MNRKWIGIEINTDYISMAKKELKMLKSKALGSDDVSGFDFVKEILKETQHVRSTSIVYKNIRKEDTSYLNSYCVKKLKVLTHTSHPRRYWNKNSQKFISLYSVSQDLIAELFLVNYAKKGTKHDDKIKVIKVLDLDNTGILKEKYGTQIEVNLKSGLEN